MKVVVIGFGWVGQANALSFSLMGYDVFYVDPADPPKHYAEKFAAEYARLKKISSPSEVDGPDTCFIVCVGDRVAEDGVQDTSLIEGALKGLVGLEGSVVLRSTIVPHTLERLQFDYYIPEFLHEKHAVEESLSPHLFVIGRKQSSLKSEPKFFALWEKRAYKVFRGTPEEAAYIKYLSNIWNSVRIAFVNEFGDAMRSPKTKTDVEAVERVVDFLFEGKYYMRYGRSFGGHCLPKDTRAFIRAHKDRGIPLPLLEGVYVANDHHKQIEHGNAALKEWFSAWQKAEVSGKVALRSLGKAIWRRVTLR